MSGATGYLMSDEFYKVLGGQPPLAKYTLEELRAEVARREAELAEHERHVEAERAARTEDLRQKRLEASWCRCVDRWARKHR